MLNWTGILS